MERLFLGSQAGDTCLAKLSARAVSRSAAAGSGVGWTHVHPQSGRCRQGWQGFLAMKEGAQAIAGEAIHSCR